MFGQTQSHFQSVKSPCVGEKSMISPRKIDGSIPSFGYQTGSTRINERPLHSLNASSHFRARGDKIAWRDAFSATKGVCSCDQRFKPNCLGTLIYLDALHESLLSVYWYHRHTFTILYIVLLLSCWYYPVVCQWIYYLRLKFVGKITRESVWVSGFHISVTHWLEDFATSHGD